MNSDTKSCPRRVLSWPSTRRPAEDEDGFTIVEMVVAMLVLSVISVLSFAFITNILQQATNVRDTMQGVQQDQTAGEGMLQYLHAATDVLSGSNANTLNVSLLAGVVSGQPGSDTFTAQLTNSASPKLDAVFSTTITQCPISATSCGTPRTVDDFDAVNSNTVFTYYYNNYSGNTATLASTTAPTTAQLSEIVAVGVDVTFLAGPHVPTVGFQAVRASTFDTTFYLQNASGNPAPTTTTTISESPAGPTVGTSVTLTATVASNGSSVDGGFVTFTVATGGSNLSVCTSEEIVDTSTGQATCTFTPEATGSYSVSGAFTGTNDYQPSNGSTSFNVLQTSTTTLTASATHNSGNNWTINATATVNPSTATGTVEFAVTCTGNIQSGCSGGSSTLSSGSAGFSTAVTISGYGPTPTYQVTATYEGDTTHGSSTSPPEPTNPGSL